MSHEAWAIVRNKEVGGIELQLALQCAPLITGLKISNLLNICKEDFSQMQEIIKGSHISYYPLLKSGHKMIILLYHKESLERYFEEARAKRLLEKAGYESFGLEEILAEFCMRYRHYMENQMNFPHEMGLLLGYPIEDVEGFIKYKGNNSLCTGYWKVYENQDRKQKLFESFENAKESLIQLLSCGVSMGDIVDICCNRLETKTVPIDF